MKLEVKNRSNKIQHIMKYINSMNTKNHDSEEQLKLTHIQSLSFTEGLDELNEQQKFNSYLILVSP